MSSSSNISINEKETKLKKNKVRKRLNVQSTFELGVMTLPGVAWFIIFCYMPMFGVVIAFKDFKYSEGVFGSRWVGFDNFMYLFQSNDAYRILRNTVGYNFLFIIVSTLLSILFAVLLDQVRRKYMIKIFQTSIMLPYFVSWVVVGYMAAALLDFENGLVNNLMVYFGGEKISWYTETKHWWLILTAANTWKCIGTSTLIYYGTIIGIDPTLYEAAAIDGCAGYKVVWHITIPLIKTAMITLLILAVGNIMRADFGLFYYLTNNSGVLYPVTDVIDTYVYRSMRVMGDISGSAAISLFQSCIGFLLVIFTNWIIKKIDNENALF